jgi:hypothetical protein
MAAGAGVLPRGLPPRLMTGVAVACAATLLAVVIWLAEPDPAPESDPIDVVRVGVVDGQSVPGYLNSSHGELTALARAPGTTDTWALVTLRSYLAPDPLAALLSGVAVAQVYARAPLDGAQTQVVRIPVYRFPGDVVAGMLDEAVRRDQERADYQQLSGRTNNNLRLRRAYDTAARVAGDEASAFRAHCACVFAAVVRATPAVLTAVADRAGVLAVDPAPEVQRLDRAEFRPPLPSTPPGAQTVAPAVAAPIPSSLRARVTSASSDDPVVGSGPSVPASEERAAVPSAPAPSRGSGAPSATTGASGR